MSRASKGKHPVEGGVTDSWEPDPGSGVPLASLLSAAANTWVSRPGVEFQERQGRQQRHCLLSATQQQGPGHQETRFSAIREWAAAGFRDGDHHQATLAMSVKLSGLGCLSVGG